MREFKLERLSDEAIRHQYERLLKRGYSAADSLKKAYDRENVPISIRFVDQKSFNASVQPEGEGALIEINAPVPLLIRILFDRLLTEPQFMPELAVDGSTSARYNVPFVLDLGNPNKRADWQVSLTEERAFASRLLAEFVMSFVILHELGHLVCGHAEANTRLIGGSHRLDMISDVGGQLKHLTRRQCWEMDADSVAVTLLIEFLLELETDCQKNPLTCQVFGQSETILESLLAHGAVSLFALFCYVQAGRNQVRSNLPHPHPLARAFYAKDMLITAARSRRTIDLVVLSQLMDERLEQIMMALEEIGLFTASAMSEHYLKQVDGEQQRLQDNRVRYAEQCRQWSWIDWF